MKKCIKCNSEKPLPEFSKEKTMKDGYKSTCKECHNRIYREKHYPNNRKKYMATANKWKADNRERWRKMQNQWFKDYYLKNPHLLKWKSLLSNTLKRLGRDKDISSKTLLGYSAIELKEHLDNRGMNWNSDQVDHIIPLSWFKNNTPVYVVCDLRNLQPLSPQDNLKKGNRFVINKNFSYINEVKHWIKEDRLNQL